MSATHVLMARLAGSTCRTVMTGDDIRIFRLLYAQKNIATRLKVCQVHNPHIFYCGIKAVRLGWGTQTKAPP